MEVKNCIKATLYHTIGKISTMNKMASTESGMKSSYYNDIVIIMIHQYQAQKSDQ